MTYSQRDSILIVDDTPTNIKVLFDCLEQAGYKISVAKSGESAIAKVQETLPDLILLDVMMPGIDGFETCRRLKTNLSTHEIPVMFMTALSDVKDKVKGLKLGAVDYITKPIQIEEVLARVTVHLSLKNAQAQLLEEVAERQQAEMMLQQALEELQQNQLQLIQVEKMASLSQMVAGVAHEINNPVNFIHGNLSHASDYAEQLLVLIKLYQQYCSDLPPNVQSEIEALDPEFLIEDLMKIFQSMQIGTNRIREIIKSLRAFSRLDEADVKTVDIHDGLDSALLFLRNRLRSKPDHPAIEIIRDYGQLPLVECYPSQMNQVFMSILSNAIDALEAHFVGRSPDDMKNSPGMIRISTEQVNEDRIVIRIADNGSGIDEALQSKLFDPFFTTKSVGKGTGLGLSISHQIVVEKHGGRLTCQSTPGQGAEFAIEIPIHQGWLS